MRWVRTCSDSAPSSVVAEQFKGAGKTRRASMMNAQASRAEGLQREVAGLEETAASGVRQATWTSIRDDWGGSRVC